MTGRPLDVYVTVGGDGYGVITMLMPVVASVRFAHRMGIYACPGEPVLLRHLCPELLGMVLGMMPEAGKPVRCRLTLEILDEWR